MAKQPADYTNRQLADVFQTIADLLEIKGEVIYKTLAYRRAAENLVELGRDIKDIWREGQLTEIPGVGKAIAEKIDELLTTGELGFLNKLGEEVPPSLAELLKVPDLGPKKVRLFWQETGITTLAELEGRRAGRQAALTCPGWAKSPRPRSWPGSSRLARRTDRTPLGDAWPIAQALLEMLRGLPGVTGAEAAGSLRRMRATVGDLDLLAAAAEPAR